MGIELEAFVYPDRISEELMCPICHNVVENPVQTPSEHLFCEDELLEWLVRSTICPVTNEPLDASTIKPPGRLISNMLASLERYCPNKSDGCEWTGKSDQVKNHLQDCSMKSKRSLIREIEERDLLIGMLKRKVSACKERCTELEEENAELRSEHEKLRKKIQVYEAFFQEGNRGDDKAMDYNARSKQEVKQTSQSKNSDASSLAKLRNYEKSIYL